MSHFSNNLIIGYDMEQRGEGRQTSALMIGQKKLTHTASGYVESLDIINSYINDEAELVYQILIGMKTLPQIVKEYGGTLCDTKSET